MCGMSDNNDVGMHLSIGENHDENEGEGNDHEDDSECCKNNSSSSRINEYDAVMASIYAQYGLQNTEACDESDELLLESSDCDEVEKCYPPITFLGKSSNDVEADLSLDAEIAEMVVDIMDEVGGGCRLDDNNNIERKRGVSSLTVQNIDEAIRQCTNFNAGDVDMATRAMLMECQYMEYTNAELSEICGYYGLKKRGNKTMMVQNLVEFEIASENWEKVCIRKKLFTMVDLLKQDPYFAKRWL